MEKFEEERTVLEDEEDTSFLEEGFMKSYDDDEEVTECAECGTAIKGKAHHRVLEGDKHTFCSKDCADEFEESVG